VPVVLLLLQVVGTTINLRQTSGTFSVGEQLIVNGLDFSRSIRTITTYSTEDIKSVKQTTAVSGLPADLLLIVYLKDLDFQMESLR
jgi:hypothetical protein